MTTCCSACLMTSLTNALPSYLALVTFIVAYARVLAEELTELRKSKPLMIAAGVIWICVAFAYAGAPGSRAAGELRHTLIDFAELLLFLLSAMTFVNTMDEQRMFGAHLMEARDRPRTGKSVWREVCPR